MQMSIQTDRKKKAQLAPLGVIGLPEVQEDDDRHKQRRLKKLSIINKQLVETLKRQNQELTKKINKQKLKVGHSIERSESPNRNLQKQKKELTNAYRQIEMYKSVLKDLKAKQISTESIDKLNMIENLIRCEDMNIDKLQKELKYVRNIKEQQEKELHIYENQDVKKSITDLEDELKSLKEKFKHSKKQAKKREDVSLKQHGYFMELQKTLRKHNDEYYPGQGTEKSKKTTIGASSGQIDQITEREWQVVRCQLVQLKKTHDENNKKIEQLTRLRNKELKSNQENEIQIKQKLRKLQTVKTKLSEITKLVSNEHQQKLRNKLKNEGNQNGPKFEEVYQNGKKVFKAKNPDDERQIKRWMIPQGYMMERGKVLPDSIFYSDKMELRMAKKHKIVKVHVWMDSAGAPSLCQFHYQIEDNRQVEGLLPIPIGDLQDFDDKLIEYKDGDYLSKITGKFNEGIMTSLTLYSKFGNKEIFNAGAPGEEFKFQPRPNEIPTCFFAAVFRDLQGTIRMCHIGCQFVTDW